jgi:hypothetical protein
VDLLYQGVHRTQYDGSAKANENCTPTSMANGARATTGGRVDRSGGSVRALVKSWEETSPNTLGWSLADGRLAMGRIGLDFVIGHDGWAGAHAALARRQFVCLQGDSEEFPNGTCSGVFDGDHCVGIHPDDLVGTLRLLADPICKFRRIETDEVLRRYASNFRPEISYGYFVAKVPIIKLPVVTGPEGWTRVTGAFWQYTVRGNPTFGYNATTREQKITQGFSANVDKIIEAYWGARDRKWGRLMAPSAYAGTWVDLLDDPNVRYIPS